MADDDAPAIPSSRKNSEKDSSRKKRRKKKQKYFSKPKRIRYDSTDSSLSSDSEHVDERRKKGKKKVRRARSRSRDRLDVSERGKMKERKNKKRKEKKKKSGKEKSRIRDASVISHSSSSSSEHVQRTRRRRSRSCSTCRSESSSPEGRGRGRSLKNRNFDKKKAIRRHGKHRSLSCSSSDGSSSSSRSWSRKRIGKGSKKRRSKVVEKGYDFGGEDGRVEITQDYADFPSSRSNDSFDGVNKREGRVTEQNPQRFVGEESHAEAEEKGSGSTYARNSEDAYEGNGVQCIHGVDEDVGPSVRLKSIVVVPVDNAKVDDLELTLRQKALENLKKFRGQTSSSLKSPTNKKTVLMDTSERREEKIQEDHSREYASDVSKKNLTMSMIDKGGTQDGNSQLVSGGKHSEKPPSPMVNLIITREGNSGDQVTKHPDISLRPEIASDNMPLTTTREGNSGDQVTKHPGISIRPEIASDNMPFTTTREENSGGQVTKHPDISIRPLFASDKMPLRPDLVVHKHKDSLRQVQREQVKCNEKLSMPSSVGCGILNSGNTKQIHSTVSEIKLAQASVSGPSSIPDQATGTNNNNEAKGEPKTESELEKKTMTVMRGGEMVQVSYKVYIPKKSPALARRQLQR